MQGEIVIDGKVAAQGEDVVFAVTVVEKEVMILYKRGIYCLISLLLRL